MTAPAGPTTETTPDVAPVAPPAAPAPARVAPGPERSAVGDRPTPSRLLLVGTSLCILATLLFGFVAELTVVGGLRHTRDQKVAFDDFRLQLAAATAPVSQTDSNGKLLAPGSPVALLDIPALGVHQTVLEGTTSSVLVSGPGHLRSSVLPGQAGTAVIMGRKAAYGGPFRRIATLAPGAVITTTTGQGVATYRVTRIRRAGDPGPAALAAGAGRLTLITASGPPYLPTGAVRVDADLVTKAADTPALVLAPSALASAESALAGDHSAWIRLVLWSQALLLAALALTWAWIRWGRWQAWVVGVPVFLFLGLAVTGQAALLLPNLM